jgi:hypothetical protein
VALDYSAGATAQKIRTDIIVNDAEHSGRLKGLFRLRDPSTLGWSCDVEGNAARFFEFLGALHTTLAMHRFMNCG